VAAATEDTKSFLARRAIGSMIGSDSCRSNPRLQRIRLRHLSAEALAEVEGYGGQARAARSPLSRKPLGRTEVKRIPWPTN
jgi:hypothetical protein